MTDEQREREFWLAIRSALIMLISRPLGVRRALLMIVRAIEKRFDVEPFKPQKEKTTAAY